MDRINNHRAKTYKTGHYRPEQIARLKESANKQEKRVARWFWANPGEAIGPSRLHEQQGYGWPLTSTRRAVSNLTDDDILLRTESTAASTRGGSEHQWRWKQPEDFKQPPKQMDAFGEPTSKNTTYSI